MALRSKPRSVSCAFTRQGHELVGAGLLLIAGVVDGVQLRSADRLRTRQRLAGGQRPQSLDPSPAVLVPGPGLASS